MHEGAREAIPSGRGAIETRAQRPDPRLAPYLEGPYRGYAERDAQPALMRETPVPFVPMIFNLGTPWRLSSARRPAQAHNSFLSGLDEHFTLVESDGAAACLQVDFTPLGARRILGFPLGEIAHRIVGLEDAFGRAAPALLDRLLAADWPGRFALLDSFFLARLARSQSGVRELAWVWRRLRDHHGQIAIAPLADELGWSHKRLIAGFRNEFGLTPRRAARIMRFARVVRGIERMPAPRWAELAADCGYYDQSHLNRDFRDFAGVTPGEYRAGRLPLLARLAAE